MTTQFKNILALALFSLLSMFSSSSIAWSLRDCWDYCQCMELSPYLGYDVQVRHIEMPASIDADGKLFKKEYPANNIYAGLRFCDYVGLEAGYSISATRTKTGVVNPGEQRFDVNAGSTAFPPELWVSKAQFKGWHGSLVGFFPFCFVGAPCDILGSIGFTRLHTSHLANKVGDMLGGIEYNSNGVSFKQEKTLLKLGIGAQMTFCDVYGIRMKFDWENTSRIKQAGALEANRPNFNLRLKNSMIYSMGAFFFF